MDNYKTRKDGITTYRVGKDYRKNELSFEDGGYIVCVAYKNGYIKEYENVKYPKRYIQYVKTSDEYIQEKIVKVWIKDSE